MPRTVIWARSEVQYAASRQSHYPGILCRSYYPKVWRYLLSLRYYGWKWWRTRSFTSVDFKGFCELSIQPMNWPNTHYIWAPDVMKGKDGKYYMYYCQPCQIYCGVSDTPVGPWKNILGEEEAVLVPDRYVKMSITLDGQTFVDDDGSVYLYWGTWGIYPNHGCGVGKLNLDMKSFRIPHSSRIHRLLTSSKLLTYLSVTAFTI